MRHYSRKSRRGEKTTIAAIIFVATTRLWTTTTTIFAFVPKAATQLHSHPHYKRNHIAHQRASSILLMTTTTASPNSEFEEEDFAPHKGGGRNTTTILSSPPLPTTPLSSVETTSGYSSGSEDGYGGGYSFFLKTVLKLQQEQQQQQSLSTIRIIPHDDDDDVEEGSFSNNNTNDKHAPVVVVPVNSLVFSMHSRNNTSDYVLAVLPSCQKVDMEKLQTAVNQILLNNNDDAQTADQARIMLSLTPTQHLIHTCGFPAHSVPPIGLCCPSPKLVVVEESLLRHNNNQENVLLLAGGGRPHQSLLVSLDIVLSQKLPFATTTTSKLVVHISKFREDNERLQTASAQDDDNRQPQLPKLSTTQQLEPEMPPPLTHKPFFAVAPPLRSQVEEILRTSQDDNDDAVTHSPLKPEWIAFVGTITAVRQVAKGLTFCDIAPPINQRNVAYTNLDTDPATLYPWKNPNSQDGGNMAVQLIVGKTFCQRRRQQALAQGDDANDPEALLKRLKPGQWIFVQGKTNVGNKDSLRNWYEKESLDVVAFDLEWIEREQTTREERSSQRPTTSTKTSFAEPKPQAPLKPTLTWSDFYPTETKPDGSDNGSTNSDSTIQLVDSRESLRAMKEAITEWLLQHPQDHGLVGIDSEWKPNFLAEDDRQAQPVLVLQVCIHPLSKVYLLDLQTLLRPMETPTEPMNENEELVSQVLQLVFSTKRFIKAGFQVLNDLQKLAASYPHVTAFERVDSILETSKFALKVFQMTQVKQGRRLATSSLNTLTEYLFRGKILDKTQQISDWSQRPLSRAQLDYAAMDAAVVVAISRLLMQSVGATVMLQDDDMSTSAIEREQQFYPAPTSNTSPLLGRFENDAAFNAMLTSARFLFLDAVEDSHAVLRLRAKAHIGSFSSARTLVATQTWNTHKQIPDIPTFTNDGSGVYTDLQGSTRVPSQTLEIDDENLEKFERSVGTRIAKSKSGCVLSLLQGHPSLEGENAVVDFPQRTGCVELQNAVILFVTLPMRSGNRRSYPNEWMEDGSILSWFLRGNDWNGGTSGLAQKLMDSDGSHVILFVRRGKGHFLNCGKCRVTLGSDHNEANEGSNVPVTTTRDGKLVKLFLLLQDWVKLYSNAEFLELM